MEPTQCTEHFNWIRNCIDCQLIFDKNVLRNYELVINTEQSNDVYI